MNNKLIEKIITANNLPCPEFKFKNPLLDKNVAEALSRSFVSILNMSQTNTTENNNLRLSILENIRKMCRLEPENHIRIGENITPFLNEAYESNFKVSNERNPTDKVLDEFLVRSMKDMNINSKCSVTVNADILQSLINLNENGVYLHTLCKDMIHWKIDNNNVHALKDLWTNGNLMIDDLSVKLKSEIEKLLLQICYSILSDVELSIEEIFMSNTDLKNLVLKSGSSANCFQISTGILNYVFIMTNYASRIQMFVQTFVMQVKQNTHHLSIAVLYPLHVRNAALLLAMDPIHLTLDVRASYLELAFQHLRPLASKNETDFIMLLSHYPQWFDVYFSKENNHI